MDENWNELLKSLGRLEQGQENLAEHVQAVSNKVDTRFNEAKVDIKEVSHALERHKSDDNAHGAGGERRGRGMVSGAIIGALTAIGGAFAIFKAVGGPH